MISPLPISASLSNRIALLLLLSPLALASSSAVTRFDFNAVGSPTQDGWIAADLGTGSDGTVSISTIALDGFDVTLDSRDRIDTAGGGDEPAMWNDFIFANTSFASAPDTGLQITITGLTPDIPHQITLWAFDDASNTQIDGFSRAADWSDGAGNGGRLSFGDGPDPASLSDYRVVFISTADADGSIVLTGLVSSVDPSSSHNVFLNGLEISDPLFDLDMDGLPDSFEQLIIDADPDDAISTIEDVLPGDDFDSDASTNLNEFERLTDPTDNDSDGDNLFDGYEDGGGEWVSATETGTDPLLPDTDGDTLLDGVENHDLAYDPGNPTGQPGTDPNLPDTDGDGILDASELADGTDPTDPDDFFDPLDLAVVKFDFNAPGSATQAGWFAADLGNGTDGTVSISTLAIGGVSVDTRDRMGTNTDTGDVDHNDLWRDFVFANGSFDSAPDSGLQITLSGLQASTTYPITIWAFDESSNAQPAGSPRKADWGPAGEEALASLSFPSSPDPASLDDYMVTFEVSTDASGQVVIDGIVTADNPSTSHNVFVNALLVGQPTGSTVIRITALDLDPEAGKVSSITWTSTPGKIYAIDQSTDLAGWPGDLDDGVPAAEDADQTTYEFDASGVGPRVYYRVREVSN